MRRFRTRAVGALVAGLALGAACAAREELAPPLVPGRLSREDARAAEAAYERGLASYQAGSYEAALQAFAVVIERYPASPQSGVALYWQGRTAYQLRRESEAVAALERYLALSPNVPFREHATLLIANSHYEQRQFEEALDAAVRIERVSRARLAEFLELSRDLIRQLPRPRVEAVAERQPSRNFLAPFYLQAARWAHAAEEEARARVLARKVLAFPELPSVLLDDARRLAGGDTPARRVASARIGFLAPTDPRFEQVSEEVRRGIELALADLNRGRRTKIELVVRRSAGEAESAEVIRDLARDERVQAILGPLVSEIAVPAARTASEEGVPLVSPTATDARLLDVGPSVYTVNALDGAIGHTIGTYAARVLERKRFAVLAVENPYGRIQADAFQAAVVAAGAEVVAREAYPPNETQFTEHLRTFVRSGADALFIATNRPQEALRVLNQLAFYELGLVPLGTDAWNDEQFLEQSGRFARGYFADPFSRDPQVTRWQEFVAAYTARYGEEPRSLIPAWGYDATRLALEVLTGTGAEAPTSGSRRSIYRGASALFRIGLEGTVRRAVVVHRIDRGQPVPLDW